MGRAHACTVECAYNYLDALPATSNLSCALQGLEPVRLTCSSAALANLSDAARASVVELGGASACSFDAGYAFQAMMIISLAFLMISLAQTPKQNISKARVESAKLLRLELPSPRPSAT